MADDMEATALLMDALAALRVLRTMCATVPLPLGVMRAEAIIADIEAYLLSQGTRGRGMSLLEQECRWSIVRAFNEWALRSWRPEMMVSVMGWRRRLREMLVWAEAVCLGR